MGYESREFEMAELERINDLHERRVELLTQEIRLMEQAVELRKRLDQPVPITVQKAKCA